MPVTEERSAAADFLVDNWSSSAEEASRVTDEDEAYGSCGEGLLVFQFPGMKSVNRYLFFPSACNVQGTFMGTGRMTGQLPWI